MAQEHPIELCVPTPDDFWGMAILQAAAFVEHSWWWESSSLTRRTVETQNNNYQTYQRYHQHAPTKLQHCRIIKSPDGKSVRAACQLQLRARTAEVFVEWLACDPAHMNQGMGSLLLAWAASFAKQELQAKVLTLYVVKANTGAVRLYERRGFVVQKVRNYSVCSQVSDGLWSLLCMGMDRHWTVLTMEKDLSGSFEAVDTPRPALVAPPPVVVVEALPTVLQEAC